MFNRRAWAVSVAMLAFFAFVSSCGGDDNNNDQSCTAGAIQTCPCTGGGQGSQTCTSAGAWGPCMGCDGSSADGNGTDSGTSDPDSGDVFRAVLNLDAQSNELAWQAACRSTPAEIANLPAGTYTISLVTSNLSKGSGSKDDYVVVNLPFEDGDSQVKERFIALNGVTDSLQFTLRQPSTLRLWFIDSDTKFNAGQATVQVMPGNHTVAVRATSNLLAWNETCKSIPAELSTLEPGTYTIKLTESTLSAAAGSSDPYVLVRLPIEQGSSDSAHRYIVLNGVGDSQQFTFKNETWGREPLRAWFIVPDGRTASGTATLEITR